MADMIRKAGRQYLKIQRDRKYQNSAEYSLKCSLQLGNLLESRKPGFLHQATFPSPTV